MDRTQVNERTALLVFSVNMQILGAKLVAMLLSWLRN